VRPAARHGIEEVYFLGLALLIGVLASIGPADDEAASQEDRKGRSTAANQSIESVRPGPSSGRCAVLDPLPRADVEPTLGSYSFPGVLTCVRAYIRR
jgi:hypothetical protein